MKTERIVVAPTPSVGFIPGKPNEYESVRTLVVLDPKKFLRQKGVQRACARSRRRPESPIVCVAEDGKTAKLSHLRNGKVVDEQQTQEFAENGIFQSGSGFDQFLMTPDGKTLFHRYDRSGDIYQTDIASNKFGDSRRLKPSGYKASSEMNQQPPMFLSHDGRYLAVHLGNGRDPVGSGYSLIDTSKSGTDSEEPLLARLSTSFTFAGPESRPVTNCELMPDNPIGGSYEFYDLLLPTRGIFSRRELSHLPDNGEAEICLRVWLSHKRLRPGVRRRPHNRLGQTPASRHVVRRTGSPLHRRVPLAPPVLFKNHQELRHCCQALTACCVQWNPCERVAPTIDRTHVGCDGQPAAQRRKILAVGANPRKSCGGSLTRLVRHSPLSTTEQEKICL